MKKKKNKNPYAKELRQNKIYSSKVIPNKRKKKLDKDSDEYIKQFYDDYEF